MRDVLELFQRAMRDGDSDAMRGGLELRLGDEGGLSAADEYELGHENYVMEMPPSGEPVSSRRARRPARTR